MVKSLDILVESFGSTIDSLPWFFTPRQNRILTRFLERDTKNPYIANLLLAVAKNLTRHNGQNNVSIEIAIEKILSEGLDGTIEVINENGNTTKISGGGALRGRFYKGEQKKVPLIFDINYGISIGAIASLFYALRTQVRKYGPESAYGVDVSAENFDIIADRLSVSLEDHSWKHHIPYASKLSTFYRGIIGEAFIPKGPLMKIYSEQFKDLRMKNVKGLRIGVSNFSNGERMIISSDNQYQDAYLGDVLDQAISFPIAFNPVRQNGVVIVDGGLHVMPLRIAMTEGADIIYLTILNHYIPEKESISGKGPLGTVRLAYRMYEVLQRDASTEAVIQQTGKNPDYVAKFGDPYGRILLSVPDLKRFDPFKLKDEHMELEDIGKTETENTINKLDPKRAHPDYNSRYFIERYRLEKNLGPKFKLAMDGF